MKSVKTMQQWSESKKSLAQFLEIGDRVDEEIQDHFLGVVPPLRGGGFTQMGEAYSSNNNGKTFLTLYGDLYLGELNYVGNFPVLAHKRRELAERLSKNLEPLIFETTYTKGTHEEWLEEGTLETGIIHENEMFYSFTELLGRIKEKGYVHPSPHNAQIYGNLFVSCKPYDSDAVLGEKTMLTLRPKNARSSRYLKKALQTYQAL